MSVISLTYSICLVYIFWNLRIFNYLDSKAIAHCTVGVRFLFSFEQVKLLFLQSLEHPMQGLMVWFRSV